MGSQLSRGGRSSSCRTQAGWSSGPPKIAAVRRGYLHDTGVPPPPGWAVGFGLGTFPCAFNAVDLMTLPLLQANFEAF